MQQLISVGKAGYFITSSEAIRVRARAAQQRRYVSSMRDAGLAHGLFHAVGCTRSFRNSGARKTLSISDSITGAFLDFRNRL